MTEKLYYKNNAETQFEARVMDSIKEKKNWKVLLDKTAFYPEGGGQPADRGWLNGIPVSDVQKEGADIYHYLREKPDGETVTGKIDTDWRNDYMQQHTGQHIISGALWKVGKYKTLSVHMGTDYTTIEIDTAKIVGSDLERAESIANRVIADDMPLSFIETEQQELHKYPLRKPCLREGGIRLVKIGDFDCVACGGIHLDSTRKARMIKLLEVEKIRGNVRIAWKIGDRVFDDYTKKIKLISGVKPLLATNEDMVVKKTKELTEEVISLKKGNNVLESRLAGMMAQELYENRQQVPAHPGGVITAVWKQESERLIKKVLKNLMKREGLYICLVNLYEGRLQWSIACSEGIEYPFDQEKGEMLALIKGKGGGRFPMWQGTGQDTERVGDFITRFRTRFLG
ncbi:MAG: hypothetical protein GY757_00605 [bacterium]|nr:hypothetical protein [bacterium]